MNLQIILVAILFLAALFYVGRRLIYNSVTAKKSCGSNCKCGVDFSQVEVNKPAR
ncbi:MAG: FeoB-associated Cys-rich membrane protein [Janthinobacterium lividum]